MDKEIATYDPAGDGKSRSVPAIVYDPQLHVIVPRDLLHKASVLIKLHVSIGACIDINDNLYNAGDIYCELSKAMIASAPQIELPQPPVSAEEVKNMALKYIDSMLIDVEKSEVFGMPATAQYWRRQGAIVGVKEAIDHLASNGYLNTRASPSVSAEAAQEALRAVTCIASAIEEEGIDCLETCTAIQTIRAVLHAAAQGGK